MIRRLSLVQPKGVRPAFERFTSIRIMTITILPTSQSEDHRSHGRFNLIFAVSTVAVLLFVYRTASRRTARTHDRRVNVVIINFVTDPTRIRVVSARIVHHGKYYNHWGRVDFRASRRYRGVRTSCQNMSCSTNKTLHVIM